MNDLIRIHPRRIALLAPVAVTALLVSACGSGSSTTGDSGAEQLATATGSAGTYLTADGGRAVYLWAGDSGSTSNCTGACASAWPPVLTTGTPTATGAAVSSDLGTTKRADGSTQVTYQGHPLYYYAGDSGAGSTNGQGNNGFGAAWWLVSPAGSPITSSGSASSSGSSSTASSGGGYGGTGY